MDQYPPEGYKPNLHTPAICRKYFASHNDYNEFLKRKMNDYNTWLCDKNRNYSIPYPGFEEEIEMLTKPPVDFPKEVLDNQAAAVKESKGKPTTRRSKGKALTKATNRRKASVKVKRESKYMNNTNTVDVNVKVSKKTRSFELYEALISKGKKAVIDAYKAELNMSDAGATTYFYNAKKLCS